MTAVLSDDDAAEIAGLLGLLERWLLHADDGILEVLGRFVWPGTCAPRSTRIWRASGGGRVDVQLWPRRRP